MPASSREDIQRGIVYVLLAVFTFSAVNALIKWLSAVYPVTELVFFRSVFALAPTFALVATHGGISQLRTRRFGEHLARAFIQFLSMTSIFTAFSMMPLADAIAITFAAPLFMTVLSIPLLGERVGIHRWGAVVVGFAGVLLMVRPGPGVLESGAVFALMNAFLSASVTIALRRLSVTESSTTLVFYQIVIPAGLSTLLLPFGWVTPTWDGCRRDGAERHPGGGGAVLVAPGVPFRPGLGRGTLQLHVDDLGGGVRLSHLGRRPDAAPVHRRPDRDRERPLYPLPRDGPPCRAPTATTGGPDAELTLIPFIRAIRRL